MFEESSFPFQLFQQPTPEVSNQAQYTSTGFLYLAVFHRHNTTPAQQMLQPEMYTSDQLESLNATAIIYPNVAPTASSPTESTTASDLNNVATSISPTTSHDHQPISMDDNIVDPTVQQQNHQMVTRAKYGIAKPIQKLCLTATKHPLQDSEFIEPTCFYNACTKPKWRKAMEFRLMHYLTMVRGHLLNMRKE